MAAGDRKMKPLYIVLLVVFLIALGGLLAVNLVGRDQVAVPAVTPPAGAAPVPVPAPVAGTPPPATEVFEIFEGRDPFRPLIVEGAAPAPAAPAVQGPAAPAPTTSVGPAAGTPAPTAAPPPREGVQVEVLSVAADSQTATIRVGSSVRENVREGAMLDSGVVVESIDGRCVSFRRSSERFRLCEGEQVLK